MNDQEATWHSLHEKPGMFDDQQTAWDTGLRLDELSTVAKSGALRPLGWPLPHHAKRLWSRSAVQSFNSDPAKQEIARRAILKFHKDKNNSRLPSEDTASGDTRPLDRKGLPAKSYQILTGHKNGHAKNFPKP
jgi:hypothetical protein